MPRGQLVCVGRAPRRSGGGYLWHRFVEHGGLLSETLRHRHWMHHEREYPAENLRPNKQYQDAKDWSWYLLGSGHV
jgi:hypothetical protein